MGSPGCLALSARAFAVGPYLFIVRDLTQASMTESRKAILMIFDGWGVRAEKKDNAIASALTPNYSRLLGEFPNGTLIASGLPVGLPDGVMGNSEVGHMNMGSGR